MGLWVMQQDNEPKHTSWSEQLKKKKNQGVAVAQLKSRPHPDWNAVPRAVQTNVHKSQ